MTAENRRQRLHRLSPLYIRAPIYFITACTYDWRQLLANDTLHGAFLQFAQEAPNRGAWVGAYVIMPDHLHLFVATDDQRITLSTWMKSLKNTLSKPLRFSGVASPHWEKTFFDHALRSGESYSAKWNYVRDNPVRAGLVRRAEDWPFA